MADINPVFSPEIYPASERILLMKKDPGALKEDIPISLPRPRDITIDRFIDLSRELLTNLRE